MNLVFDASAIIRLIELNPNKAVNTLRNQYTIDLAYYEIGNYLWKISKLSPTINMELLIKAFNKALSLMNIESMRDLSSDILDLAGKADITYYDASYVYLAMKLNAKLITEDGELMSKFPDLTMSINKLM